MLVKTNKPSIHNEMSLVVSNQDEKDEEQQQQHTAINFSICNILSDKFGQKSTGKCKLKKQNDNKTSLFRPYDIKNNFKKTSDEIVKFTKNLKIGNTILSKIETNQTKTETPTYIKTEQFSHFRLNDVYDLSKKSKVNQDNRNYEISSINYPKIHEEVSSRKYQTSITKQKNKHLTEMALSKIPQLGGLCKAISQIDSKQITISNLSFSSKIESTINQLPQHEQQQQQQQLTRDSGVESSDDTRSETGSCKDDQGQWPAWVFCTRYSDRPSSGPRYRRPKQPKDKMTDDEKRPRTAFSSEQLARLKREFTENRYLNERRRQQLSDELGLNEAQIKIWFQNKRAKIKKTCGEKNPLAMQLMAQGLYNHTTVPLTKEEEELEMRMNGQLL